MGTHPKRSIVRKLRKGSKLADRIRRQAQKATRVRTQLAARVHERKYCIGCRDELDIRRLAKRCAAFLTQSLGPDPLSLRFAWILQRARERVQSTARVKCGNCEGYPPADAFNSQVEINDNPLLRKNVIKWMGTGVFAPSVQAEDDP